MKRAFVAGGVSYDLIINLHSLPDGKPGSLFSMGANYMVGGTGAGKSLNLDRLGFDTMFHAFIGNDDNGDKIKEYFSKTNVKFVYEIDPEATQGFTNLVDKDGKRISIFTFYNTFKPDFDKEKVEKYIKESDFVVLNIMNYVRELIPIAKKHDKEIWCDIHDFDLKNDYHADFINGADFIQMSSDHIPDYRAYMEELIGKGKKLVICTHGKDGACAINDKGEWVEEPILEKYKKVDINGAGDSFFSGVMWGYSNGKSLKESIRYGTIAAGLCITSKELYYEGLSGDLLEAEYRECYGGKEI